MCEVLKVTCSSYFTWLNQPLNSRERANQALLEQIQWVSDIPSIGTAGEWRIASYKSPLFELRMKYLSLKCTDNITTNVRIFLSAYIKQNSKQKLQTALGLWYAVQQGISLATDKPISDSLLTFQLLDGL